jgi:hypothetical protein
LLLLLGAATRPGILGQTSGGLWEVSGAPGSSEPKRLCIADPGLLAQFEHRTATCTRVVIREQGTSAEVHYTCPGGGFGQTTMTLLTPRSLRIHTQGISGAAPFNYLLQARRLGTCRQNDSPH